jgi:hypothetical protein
MSSRLALLGFLVAASAACTKSAANQETPGSTTGGGSAPERIAAPGEKIAAPGGVPGGAIGGEKGVARGVDKAEAAGGPDSSFKIALEVPASVAPGAETVAKVTVTPGEGYKVNEEYPSRLSLEPPTGLTVVKPVLEKEDAAALDKHQLAFAIKLTATAAGSYKVNGSLKFAVCTAATCDPKKQAIAFDVVAK